MKFSILLLESPYNHEAGDTAYNFIQAALQKGHEIQGVFFYSDGVYNANRLIDTPQDDRNIARRWSALGETGIDLVVCIAAGKRRGLTEEDLIPHARISGLGQLAGMIRDSDRIVTFGD